MNQHLFTKAVKHIIESVYIIEKNIANYMKDIIEKCIARNKTAIKQLDTKIALLNDGEKTNEENISWRYFYYNKGYCNMHGDWLFHHPYKICEFF